MSTPEQEVVELARTLAQRLSDGSWLLPREACQGTCNLVHVDDISKEPH